MILHYYIDFHLTNNYINVINDLALAVFKPSSSETTRMTLNDFLLYILLTDNNNNNIYNKPWLTAECHIVKGLLFVDVCFEVLLWMTFVLFHSLADFLLSVFHSANFM